MTSTNLDFSFADINQLHDNFFFNALDSIRDQDPVFWSDAQQSWFITRHEDVLGAFNDDRWSAKRLHSRQFDAVPEADRDTLIPHLVKYVPDWINNIDNPQHGRIRRLVLKSFNRKVVDDLRPDMDAICKELIKNGLQRLEFDFVEEIAFRLPATVISRLLGIPDSCIDKMRDWGNSVTAALAGFAPPKETLLAAEKAMQEMTDVVVEEFEKRKSEPGKDLISALAAAMDDPEAMTLEEAIAICHLTIIAGHDSTANSIGLGLIAFENNPEQKAKFVSGEVDSLQAMAELLRHISVASVQPRVAKEAITLRGKTIEPGQFAFLCITAANRDPQVFDNPDQLDFSRSKIDRSAVFAPGFHHCLGHYLARVELEFLFRNLYEMVDQVEIFDQELRFQPNVVFRGIEHLQVRLTPKAN